MDITSEVIVGALATVGTTIAAAVASRSSRAVTKIPVEAEAYSRARQIDDAANARLAAENAHLRSVLEEERTDRAEERAEWTAERSRLRAEINELETKLRELLDEVISFRSRSGLDEEGA